MNKILFSKFSNERDPKYAIRTEILVDECGRRVVQKSPATPEATAYVQNFPVIYQGLTEVYQGSRFQANHCEYSEQKASFEYLEEETLEEVADILLETDVQALLTLLADYVQEIRTISKGDIFRVTPEFEKVFGKITFEQEMPCAKNNNIDMVLHNIIVTDKWNVIDYEWTFNFPIPVNYVIYRVLFYYAYENNKRKILQSYNLFERMGITKEEISLYEKMEHNFQHYVLGSHVPLRELYPDISLGMIPLDAMIKQGNVEETRVYFDEGAGFTQENSKVIGMNQLASFEYRLELNKNLVNLRIDPCERPCITVLEKVEIDGVKVQESDLSCNGSWIGNHVILFNTSDPQIMICKSNQEATVLEVKISTNPLEDEFAGHMLDSMENDTQGDGYLQKLKLKMQEKKKKKALRGKGV